MPKIKDVLDKVKTSDAIPDSIKVRWLGELDRRVYRLPDDMDAELLYSDSNIYELYLKAMNDFFTGDMESYRVSSLDFHIAYEGRMYSL